MIFSFLTKCLWLKKSNAEKLQWELIAKKISDLWDEEVNDPYRAPPHPIGETIYWFRFSTEYKGNNDMLKILRGSFEDDHGIKVFFIKLLSECLENELADMGDVLKDMTLLGDFPHT